MLESLIQEVSKKLEEGLCVELPDGRVLGSGNCKVKVKDKNVILNILKDPEMGFGEAYMKGAIEIDGDIERFLVACLNYLEENKQEKNFRNSLFRNILKYTGLLKFTEEKEVRSHYDLGNDFYKLWLDDSMTYSCAFFTDAHQSLEMAQKEKRKIIYGKLQLTDGDKLLDIGCGWGAIILEVSKLYNIEAVGITVSKNQYDYVKSKIENNGLSSRTRVYLMHYEDLPSLGEKFNKIVSVGMFEHVGKGRHKDFFKIVHNTIEEKGLFLLHTIGKVLPESQSKWIRKYIFPGGYLPALTEIIEATKGSEFNLIDIDDWRLHYYKTLQEWRKRFYKHAEEVVKKKWRGVLPHVGPLLNRFCGIVPDRFQSSFSNSFSKGVLNEYPVIKRQFLSPITINKLSYDYSY